jgi:hypothetical protein
MSLGHDDDWSGQHYRDTQVVTIVLMLLPDGESPIDCDIETIRRMISQYSASTSFHYFH